MDVVRATQRQRRYGGMFDLWRQQMFSEWAVSFSSYAWLLVNAIYRGPEKRCSEFWLVVKSARADFVQTCLGYGLRCG